ncbi:hypothetical protein JL720_10751 [Aureococcus anophagefferens]|nr:hypothetical protein JL720_10751 [Aureococcus anophagefferens]
MLRRTLTATGLVRRAVAHAADFEARWIRPGYGTAAAAPPPPGGRAATPKRPARARARRPRGGRGRAAPRPEPRGAEPARARELRAPAAIGARRAAVLALLAGPGGAGRRGARRGRARRVAARGRARRRGAARAGIARRLVERGDPHGWNATSGRDRGWFPAVVTRPAADADDAALNFEIYSGPRGAAGPAFPESSVGAINGAVDVALLPAEYGTKSRLVSSDTAALDQFGVSVAIHNDIIVVGANHDDDAGYDSGSAYIFKTSDGGATWPQVAKLVAPDAEAGDRFGWSVAVEGNLVVVGAMEDDTNAGSAYAFLTSDGGATWDQGEKFVADDRAAEGRFGSDVKISGDVVVVGAYWDGGSDFSTGRKGAAYVFRATDGRTGWTQAKLVASDRAVWDHFGYAVSINEAGDVIAVGSYGTTTSAPVLARRMSSARRTASGIASEVTPSSTFGSDGTVTLVMGVVTTGSSSELTGTLSVGVDCIDFQLAAGFCQEADSASSCAEHSTVSRALDPTALVGVPGSAVQDENGIITLTLGVTIGVAMSSSTAGNDTQTVSESLDLGVAAHRVALASSPTAPCDIYSASASSTMDANSRVCLMLNTTDEDSESYVAFLKTATVRNLDSGLEYALVSNRKFGQSAPGYKYAGAWLNDAHADLAELTKAPRLLHVELTGVAASADGIFVQIHVSGIDDAGALRLGAVAAGVASGNFYFRLASNGLVVNTVVLAGDVVAYEEAAPISVVDLEVESAIAFENLGVGVQRRQRLQFKKAIVASVADVTSTDQVKNVRATLRDAGADYAATYLSEFVAGVAAAADDGLFVQVLQQGGQVFADVAVDVEATSAVLEGTTVAAEERSEASSSSDDGTESASADVPMFIGIAGVVVLAVGLGALYKARKTNAAVPPVVEAETAKAPGRAPSAPAETSTPRVAVRLRDKVVEEEKGQESLAVGAMKLGSKKASPLNDLDDVVLPVFAEYADDEEVERAAAQPLDEDEASIFWEDLRREASSWKKVYGSAEANRVERELLERFGRFKGARALALGCLLFSVHPSSSRRARALAAYAARAVAPRASGRPGPARAGRRTSSSSALASGLYGRAARCGAERAVGGASWRLRRDAVALALRQCALAYAEFFGFVAGKLARDGPPLGWLVRGGAGVGARFGARAATARRRGQRRGRGRRATPSPCSARSRPSRSSARPGLPLERELAAARRARRASRASTRRAAARPRSRPSRRPSRPRAAP